MKGVVDHDIAETPLESMAESARQSGPADLGQHVCMTGKGDDRRMDALLPTIGLNREGLKDWFLETEKQPHWIQDP